jgi:hypothetical protein
MIARSLCDLEHLTFLHLSRVFLTVMPHLTTLDINDPDPELIENLCHFQGGEWTVVPSLQSFTMYLSMSYEEDYLAALSRLAGIRCDTVSPFRADQPSLLMLKTLKIAIHGSNNFLSHFYYASLQPPKTELEAYSANEIAEVYKSGKPVWDRLESLLNIDPQGVAGVYVRALF